MTDTIAYIQQSLKDLYPKNEILSFTRLIMEEICGIPPHHLLFGKGKELSDTEKLEIKEIIEQLKKYKPLQYILGKTDFYGRTFRVGPSVLIPRPETEELIEQILNDLKAGNDLKSEGDQKGEGSRPLTILDIGTGSGCIAVTLAKEWPEADVIATDVSQEALETARENARRLHAPVTFVRTDILSLEKAEADIPFSFDLIVSNPPYVTEREKAEMEPNVLEYEPSLALFVSNDDPLLFYRAIARFGKKKLKKGGRLYFEINASYGPETVGLLEEEGYRQVRLLRDLSDHDRMIKANL